MSETLRGRDLRVHRQRAGLTQRQIADRLGMHHSLISAAEMETIAEVMSPDFTERFLAACGPARAVSAA